MTLEDRTKWDAKYDGRSELSSPSPWLEQMVEDLPNAGTALDLACGDGANAILLARIGWRVTAVDISQKALDLGRRFAADLPIEWTLADLDEWEPATTFDLVVVFRYLDRVRLPLLVQRGLKPGGRLIAETFNGRAAETSDGHVRNQNHLLRSGEWKTLFPKLDVIVHDESGATSRLVAICR